MPGSPVPEDPQPSPEPGRTAPRQLAVQYVGFTTSGDRREYKLRAREGNEYKDYVVAIPFECFGGGRAKLQDGPEICYGKVMKELTESGLGGPSQLLVTDQDLEAYREAHSPAPTRRRGRPAAAPEEPGAEPEEEPEA